MTQPGHRNCICIQDPRIDERLTTYIVYEAKPSTEPARFHDRIKRRRLEKKFNREDSAFAMWPNEVKFTYTFGINYDFKFWKIGRFVKDSIDVSLLLS